MHVCVRESFDVPEWWCHYWHQWFLLDEQEQWILHLPAYAAKLGPGTAGHTTVLPGFWEQMSLEQQRLYPWQSDGIAFHLCVPHKMSAHFLFPIHHFGYDEKPCSFFFFFPPISLTLFPFRPVPAPCRFVHTPAGSCRQSGKQSLQRTAIKSSNDDKRPKAHFAIW